MKPGKKAQAAAIADFSSGKSALEIVDTFIDHQCESGHLLVGEEFGFGLRDPSSRNERYEGCGIADELPILTQLIPGCLLIFFTLIGHLVHLFVLFKVLRA